MRVLTICLMLLGIASMGATPCPTQRLPLTIAAYGDSLTESVALDEVLWLHAIPEVWDVTAEGVPGETCAQIVARLEADLPITADVVVLACGANDIRQAAGVYDEDATIATITTGIAAIQNAGMIAVVHVTPEQHDAVAEYLGFPNVRLAALRTRIIALTTSTGAKLADVYSAMLAAGGSKDAPGSALYDPDLLHLSYSGNGVMGNEIERAITE